MALIEKTLLYPKETIYRTPPKNLHLGEEYLFKHEYECNVSDCFSYLYSDAVVNSRGHAIHYTESISQVIPQCITEEVVSKKFIVKTFLENMKSTEHSKIPKAILFTDTNAHGYFHWIIDALPKLTSIRNLLKSDFIVLLPEKYYTPFVDDSLSVLKIAKSQIFLIKKNTKVLIEQLWVMGHPAQPAGTGNYRPKQLKAFQKHIKEYYKIPKDAKDLFLNEYGNKIYISRKDASYRYLINEDEIIDLLDAHGFSTIYASQFTIQEQIILFSQARIVLSLHGAGLSNIIWMSSGTAVAEIRQEGDAHNNCYFSLASALDINYYFSLASTNKKNSHTANFLWNKNNAKILLEQMHV